MSQTNSSRHNLGDLTAEIVAVGRRLDARGLVVASDGNISSRVDVDRLLITASASRLGQIEAEDCLLVDFAGHVDERWGRAGAKPSSELPMHVAAYRSRPDVRSIVHAHPVHAVALSAAGRGPNDCVFPEGLIFLGAAAVADYATPATPEGARIVREAAREQDVIVLDRHGSLALGSDPWDALDKTERLEHVAQASVLSLLLGGVREGSGPRRLSNQQAETLIALRSAMGLGRPGDRERLVELCEPGLDANLNEPSLRAIVERVVETLVDRGWSNQR